MRRDRGHRGGAAALAAALVLLTACSATLEVRSYHDAGCDFGRLRTYDWLPSRETGDPRIEDERLDARVKRVVDAELARRGYRRVESGAPDFRVGYYAMLARRSHKEAVPVRYAYPGPVPAGPDHVEAAYYQGTLILDIVDGISRKVVWRATARETVDTKASEAKRERKMREAVRRMLESFPPGS